MYQYAAITKPGGLDVFELKQAEVPQPQAGEIRMKAQAAGVAFPDLYYRTGVALREEDCPYVPGYDVAGTVDALGEGVTDFEIGQRVVGVPQKGCYAEYICAPAADFVPIPDDVAAADAVAVALNGVMARQILHRMARAVSGESLLVHTAAGGIGNLIVQLGRLASLHVYGTASSAKQDVLKSLGATPIDRGVGDWVARIKELTTDGVDIALDSVGPNDHWQQSFEALRIGGRLISYGFMGIMEAGMPVRERIQQVINEPHKFGVQDMTMACKSVGGYSFQTMKDQRPEWYRDDLTQMLSLVHMGMITPLIGARVTLDRVAEAHEMISKAAVAGKVVIEF